MGVFHVELEIGDPRGQNYHIVEAMVDSGATYTTMPASLLRDYPQHQRRSKYSTSRDNASSYLSLGEQP